MNKNYTAEIAIIEDGIITGWDADAIQDYIEAESAAEAIEFAKDYLHNCIHDNGFDTDEKIIVRVAEINYNECGGLEFGEWVYDDN